MQVVMLRPSKRSFHRLEKVEKDAKAVEIHPLESLKLCIRRG